MDALFFELKQTVKDIGSSRLDWRSLGRKALPVALVAAAGVGGLAVRKQQAQPENDLLVRRAVFECSPATALVKSGLLPPPGELERFMKERNADIFALRRAARRLRGPIERDLLLVEQTLQAEGAPAGKGAESRRRQLYEELLATWRERGYLREPMVRKKPRSALDGIDIISQVDESYGRDCGCEVPLCLLETDQASSYQQLQCLAPAESAKAVDAMSEHGFALLKSFLSRGRIDAMRETLQMKVSALDFSRSGKGKVPPVREYDMSWIQEKDEDLEPHMSTMGRRHLYLRDRFLEEVVRDVQAGLMPLVWDYLEKAAGACGMRPGQRPYLSEVQLLVTDPCAVGQFFHVDNVQPGITVMVPLTNVPAEIGPTCFLPGSHHLVGPTPGQDPGFFSRLSAFTSSAFSTDGVTVGAMSAGDALIYDSRMLHYGAANKLYDRTRVALVFRYDFERPPGMGLVGAQLTSWAGNILGQVLKVYAALPGGKTTPATPVAAKA